MLSVSVLDVPPDVPFDVLLLPPGFVTVMEALPVVAMSAALTWASSSVAETYVVDRLVPFHCTVDEPAKPDPSTVILNAGPAAATEVGEIEVTRAVQPATTPSRTTAHICRADISNSLHSFVPPRRGRCLGRSGRSVAPPQTSGKTPAAKRCD